MAAVEVMPAFSDRNKFISEKKTEKVIVKPVQVSYADQ